jgi:carboxyl-terminal processing protease
MGSGTRIIRIGKEVLAYGFKKYGFGQIVGPGSALAGRAFMMSNGGLLLLAVADDSVNGERLEGKGVTPTIDNPQIARAIDLLKTVSD